MANQNIGQLTLLSDLQRSADRFVIWDDSASGAARSKAVLARDIVMPGDFYIDPHVHSNFTVRGVNGGEYANNPNAYYGSDAIRTFGMATGGNSNGEAQWFFFDVPGQGGKGFNRTLGAWRFFAEIQIPTLSDGTNTFGVVLGWGWKIDSSGIFFRYQYDVNSGNWQGVARNGGSETVVNSSTAPSTSSYQKLLIQGNAAGTSFEFFINGTSIGTVTTNLPSAHDAPAFCISIQKLAGTTSRSVNGARTYAHCALA